MFRGFLAIKSLVVGLAVLGLWGRSYFVGDEVRRGDAAQYIQLSSGNGSVVITFGHDGKDTRLRGSWDYVAAKEPRQVIRAALTGDSPWNRVGFGFTREMLVLPVRGMIVHIAVPHWLIFLLAIPAAGRWAMRRWFTADARDIDDGMLECPRCGQMFSRVPSMCPICGQPLIIAEFR
jgi:ribosomal protein S27AE